MHVEDKKAIDAALAGLAGNDIHQYRLGSALRRALGVSRKLLKTGMALRKELEDRDDKHWIRVPPKAYLNSITDGTSLLVVFDDSFRIFLTNDIVFVCSCEADADRTIAHGRIFHGGQREQTGVHNFCWRH